MDKDMARADAPGSHPSDQAPAGLGAPRFDPSRDRGIHVGKSWPRPATPCDLVPRWEGEFVSHGDWVNFATKRLTVASDSNGNELKAICVDAFGRRCANGRDMARARDEGAFPVRYFWDCWPASAIEAGTAETAGLRAQHESAGRRLRPRGTSMTQPNKPVSQRAELKPCPNDAFWAKVEVRGGGECWPWKAARNAKGYGNFRSRSAHVVSFEMAHGPVPIGCEVDHTCKNRPCVNPAHLEAVTHAENVRRSQVTHCKRGHALSGDNIKLQYRPDGVRRRCVACRKLERSHG